MNSGEGNGKPLLHSKFCLENPHQEESKQTSRTTTTTTTTEITLEAQEVLKILSMYSCLVKRMEAKITTSSWVVIVRKCGKVHILGNDTNKSKLSS
jgi:hypothetical protein